MIVMTKSNQFMCNSVINYVSSVSVDCYVRQMNISGILDQDEDLCAMIRFHLKCIKEPNSITQTTEID